jgi:hypothetical protein
MGPFQWQADNRLKLAGWSELLLNTFAPLKVKGAGILALRNALVMTCHRRSREAARAGPVLSPCPFASIVAASIPVWTKDFSQSAVEGPRTLPFSYARPGQRVKVPTWKRDAQVRGFGAHPLHERSHLGGLENFRRPPGKARRK